MINREKNISELRAFMTESAVDAYIISHNDEYDSEYIHPADKRIGGILCTGSYFGWLLVLPERMAFFASPLEVDDAKHDFSDAGVDVFDYSKMRWTQWLKENCPAVRCIGYDPATTMVEWLQTVEKRLEPLNVTMKPVPLPVARVWPDRPVYEKLVVTLMPNGSIQTTASEKITKVVAKIKEAGAAALLVTDPIDCAWLLNMRGNDLPTVPVPFARALIDGNGKIELFVRDCSAFAGVVEINNVDIVPNSDVAKRLQRFAGCKVLIDLSSTNTVLFDMLKECAIEPVKKESPVAALRAVKDDAEIKGFIESSRYDSRALVRFMHELQTVIVPRREHYNEYDLVERLLYHRRREESFLQISYEPIVGLGANGAAAHYLVNANRAVRLDKSPLLLIDSGGHYTNGTTDVTRVFALGAVTDEMKFHYTAVLRAHIAVYLADFAASVTGAQIDHVARQVLWNYGLDFMHSTGHGIGHRLSVHESPPSISPYSGNDAVVSNMVFSNEPALYFEGRYGIRIENIGYMKPSSFFNGFCRYETLTLVPYERALIDVGMLTTAERDWLNDYHARVLREIGPLVEPDVRTWLVDLCAAV